MRNNKFENKVEGLIKSFFNITPLPNESVRSMEVLKQATDRPILFTDAGSPYPTPTGQQKRTEFVLYCPDYGIDWRIECKSRKTISLIGEITIELNHVADIPEKRYCLVLSKVLDHEYVLNKIQQEIDLRQLNGRVWYGTKKQLKKLIKQQMK